jgi:hypothetical protein
MKKPLVPVDMERRTFLGMKRAEAFICRTRLPERDIFLHHLKDVGLEAKVVYESLGESHGCILNRKSAI